MLTFDAETHKYYWSGKEVPGVSHILKTIGITRDYTGVNEFYRERGVHVHKAIELYVGGRLDEDSLDPENVKPYFDAYLSFLKKYPFKTQLSELMLYSNDFEMAGTMDGYGSIDGYDGIIDYKVTENSDKAAHLQMCGYQTLLTENLKIQPHFLLALELHGDGSFDTLFYKPQPSLWNSVMELFIWKTTRRTKELKEPFFYASTPGR